MNTLGSTIFPGAPVRPPAPASRRARRRARADIVARTRGTRPSARELFPLLLDRLEQSRPIDIETGRRDMKAKPNYRNVYVDGRLV